MELFKVVATFGGYVLYTLGSNAYYGLSKQGHPEELRAIAILDEFGEVLGISPYAPRRELAGVTERCKNFLKNR